jgi:hypothetical protein
METEAPWKCSAPGCVSEDSKRRRRGPTGSRTLCNRCGLRYWRAQRRIRREAEKDKSTPAPNVTSLHYQLEQAVQAGRLFIFYNNGMLQPVLYPPPPVLLPPPANEPVFPDPPEPM